MDESSENTRLPRHSDAPSTVGASGPLLGASTPDPLPVSDAPHPAPSLPAVATTTPHHARALGVAPGAVLRGAGSPYAERLFPRAGWHARPLGWVVSLLALLMLLAPEGPGASDLFAAGAAAQAAWRYDRALAFYQRAADLNPADWRPWCLEGKVLALQQRYPQAADAYDRCRALGNDGPSVWLALGDIAQARGDTVGAEHAWLRSAAQGGAEARRRLGGLYETEGRLDLAAAQWQVLAAGDGGDGEAQAHLGQLALAEGDYVAARAHFVAARELPGFAGQDAVDHGFVALAGVAPEDGVGLARVGFAFLQADQLALARLPLEKSLAAAPDFGPTYAYLGWIAWQAGDVSEAQVDLATALRLAPRDPFTLFASAELAMAARQWTTARTELAQALTHDGENPALWAEQARADLATRDYLGAELSYDTAARLATDPLYSEVLLRYYLDHRLGQTDGRALFVANSAAVRWPHQARIQELAGQLYALAGQPTLAYLAYQRANALDPSDPQPYLDLGRIAFYEGEYVTAALDLRTVVALRPDGPLAEQARALLSSISTVAA
jgi:tetratricopeptide (TPR) repeat protein